MGLADCTHDRIDFVTEKELRCVNCLLVIRIGSGTCARPGCERPIDDHLLMDQPSPQCPPKEAAA